MWKGCFVVNVLFFVWILAEKEIILTNRIGTKVECALQKEIHLKSYNNIKDTTWDIGPESKKLLMQT